MFKQITNFENFNIFLGEKEDLILEQNNDKFSQQENLIEYVIEKEINRKNMEEIINKSFAEINGKNIYIITKSKKEFLDI